MFGKQPVESGDICLPDLPDDNSLEITNTMGISGRWADSIKK